MSHPNSRLTNVQGDGISHPPPAPPSGSAEQLCAHQLAHGPRIGLAARLLHHLADEEPEQALLAAPERGNLARDWRR